MQLLACSERVADTEVARVGEADDVARIGLLYRLLALGHEGCGTTELELLA